MDYFVRVMVSLGFGLGVGLLGFLTMGYLVRVRARVRFRVRIEIVFIHVVHSQILFNTKCEAKMYYNRLPNHLLQHIIMKASLSFSVNQNCYFIS